jgi:hypothetical protein
MRYIALFGLFCLLMLSALALPLTAQDVAFPTNTPSGSSSTLFATNTPAPIPPTATPLGPQAELFNYGLRLWNEAAFLSLLYQQIAMLSAEDLESQLALNLTLYEMNLRFPDAPSNLEERRRLVNAMLAAPIGTIDMRSTVRPLIEAAINQTPDSMSLEAEGFDISLTAANLDNRGGEDRIAHVRYETDGITYYEEYLLLLATERGFRLLDTDYTLYAVPYGGIESVSLMYLQDVNHDAVDDLVLRVDNGGVNDLFYIIGHRNEKAGNLVDSTTPLLVGTLVAWPFDDPAIRNPEMTVLELRPESAYPDWPCNSQIEYHWTYERNLYRRFTDLNARFEEVDSLGCNLRNANLFALEPNEAVVQVENALLNYGFDAAGSNRAILTLAMLYVLTGRLDDARNLAQSAMPVDAPNSWEALQADALLRGIGASGNTALDICQAMALASDYPACEMNDVLGRYLQAIPFKRDTDLVEQLNEAGLLVAQSLPLREVGRANRTLIYFALAETDWWAFVERSDGSYSVEAAEAPAGFEETILPIAQIQPSQAAYDALFLSNDPNRVLTILDNLSRQNPDAPLSPSGLFLQALAYDLTGARETARRLYYEVWETYPDTVWALVAGEHLELR